MQSNFKDFITKQDGRTVVNYALANKFVSFDMPSIVTEGDNAEASIPHQEVLERLIIANSGNLLVSPGKDGSYRLMIAHQGVPMNMPTKHNITICLDLSASMRGGASCRT